MKKLIVAIAFALISFMSFAQKDTTVINSSKLSVDIESYINKKGETKYQYWVKWDGELYASNKSTYDRAILYKRFGYDPLYVLITDKRSKAQRIVIL